MNQSESSFTENAPSRGVCEANKVQTNKTGAANTNTYDKLLAEISKAQGHSYFETLQKYEPNINWIKFAAKIHAKSDSVRTVINYSQGICNFRNYLIEEKRLRKNAKSIIYDVVAEIKAEAKQNNGQSNGLVYKIFDDFVLWLKARDLRSNPIHGYVNGTKRLFLFLDVDIDQNKFRDKVTTIRNHKMHDEWPENDEIRKILNASQSIKVRGFIQLLNDTGLEPVDAAQLRVKNFKFDEEPVRGIKDREKTGEPLEFFLNKETVDALKQIIDNDKKGPNDYMFIKSFRPLSVQKLREYYNLACARAGFGTLVPTKNGYWAKVDKIEGHKFGKFHLKVFKKRWFSLAIMAGVPVYVVQGMLGRKEYLDEYMRVPLDKKREFARKILRQVSIYREEKNQEQALEDAAKILGLEKLTPEQAAQLREKLGWLTKPAPKLKEILENGLE